MDMFSLSRDEVCRSFNLQRSALDALIDAGHILCHVSDGEPRIPIDQLESFFLGGLLRVYRTQAADTAVTMEHRPETVVTPEIDERPAEAVIAALPGTDIELPLPPTAAELRTVHSEREEDEEEDTLDLRVAPRYIPRRQINGIIDDVRFTIVQISNTGLRIRHSEEILPSGDSKLTFALLNPARSFVMRGRVVWTSAATTESGERKFYISGVKITEHADRLVNAIHILKASHDLQPDRRAIARPTSEEDELPAGTASDDEIAMVMKAVQHFAADPLDANRWYARGRFALAEPQVRKDAPRKPREREEVLGIWEFLDRKVDMAKITDIVGWARKNRASAPAARV
jgi:hypothetical protein